MARRRLTIKRIDPWSVLKFGAFLSVVLYLVFLVVAGVVWFVIDRLQLIDQVCEIALDVGFTTCAVDGPSVLQVVALLGGMWAIVQTALLVFLAFLHNLIADLTGGLVVGIVDDTPSAPAGGSVRTGAAGRSATTGATLGAPGSVEQPTPGVPVATSRATEARSSRRPPRARDGGDALFGDEG